MAKGKVTTKWLETILDKQIVLDTSVIFILSDPGYRGQMLSVLDRLTQQRNELFVSEVSLYELNKTSVSGADVARRSKLLGKFTPLPLTQSRSVLAGILFSTMKRYQKDLKNKENDVGCDMLIGGTVIENSGALLMTTNIKDFCPPCWEVVAEGRVIKKGKQYGWSMENWYLLKFDYAKMSSEFLSDELKQIYHSKQSRLLLPPKQVDGGL